MKHKFVKGLENKNELCYHVANAMKKESNPLKTVRESASSAESVLPWKTDEVPFGAAELNSLDIRR